MKPWWQSKTIWVNLLTVLIMIFTDVQVLDLSAETLSGITFLLALLNIALRVVTSTTIFFVQEDTNDSME